jgi:hypothetical protein
VGRLKGTACVLLVAAPFAATSCASPSISVTAPAAGSHVRGNVVTLHVATAGIDSSRYAVFIDRGAVAAGAGIPTAADVVEGDSPTVVVAGLAIGRHVLTVVAADGSDRRLTSAAGTLNVSVDGPATTVAAPLSVGTGQPVQLKLNTFGITIVDISGDSSGRTAHYEIIVDGALPRPGQAIAAAAAIRTSANVVMVPALARGRHVIWIVLADGANRVLDPLVAARAAVTVTA